MVCVSIGLEDDDKFSEIHLQGLPIPNQVVLGRISRMEPCRCNCNRESPSCASSISKAEVKPKGYYRGQGR